MTANIIARERFPQLPLRVRHVVFIIGIFFWIGLTCFNTGINHALSALVSNALFAAAVAFVCTKTRTVSWNLLIRMFMFGGFMLALTIVIADIAYAVFPILSTTLRNVFHPPLEEVCRMAPLLFLLWKWRAVRTWTLGAGDIMCLGCALGAGFNYLEDAHIRAHGFHGLSFLLTMGVYGGHVIARHAIWSGIEAGAIGLALLLMKKRSFVPLIAIACGWCVFDHAMNNVNADIGNSWLLLAFIGNGYFSILLFVALLAAVIWFDTKANKQLPATPEGQPPQSSNSIDSLQGFAVCKRRLAYAAYRYLNSTSEKERNRFLQAVLYARASLRSCHLSPPNTAARANTV